MAIGQGWAEGSFVDASWVTAGLGAWVQAGATKTIGGTSQLELFTSSGTIAVLSPKTIGAASQLEAFLSSGQLDVQTNHTIGGSSQLSLFTSSGFIQVVLAATTSPTGGFWNAYAIYQHKAETQKKERSKLRAKAQQIQDKLDRELAKEYLKGSENEARLKELNVLISLTEAHKAELDNSLSEKLLNSAQEAYRVGSYSAMERLERELGQAREEEEFLLLATEMILNQ